MEAKISPFNAQEIQSFEMDITKRMTDSPDPMGPYIIPGPDQLTPNVFSQNQEREIEEYRSAFFLLLGKIASARMSDVAHTTVILDHNEGEGRQFVRAGLTVKNAAILDGFTEQIWVSALELIESDSESDRTNRFDTILSNQRAGLLTDFMRLSETHVERAAQERAVFFK